ncbi:hypothetical protein DFH28DRAFT_1073008 [Melampsora americana]|nr:hypothetical protein DFH28DRAFT_1073008 [Melampsora americana]
MNKNKFSWGWYLIVSFSFCVLNLSGRLLENVMEENIPAGGSARIDLITTHGNRIDRFEDMQERFKELETFGPFNEEHKDLQHKTHSRNRISALFHIVPDFRHLWIGFNQIEKLARMPQYNHPGISLISNQLLILLEDPTNWISIFVKGRRFERIILITLCYLQKEDLELYDRLWALSVLETLQSFLPRGELEPIRQDPKSGSVCRGGLELFLLKGLDYAPRVKSVFFGIIELFPLDESITESLKRVDLIVKIRNYLDHTEQNIKTPTLKILHDQLLQNRSLDTGGIIESLSLQSMHHIISENTPDNEIECLYNILQHFETFYPVTKKFGISQAVKRLELIENIRASLQGSERPQMMDLYRRLYQIRCGDDTVAVKSLALKCMEQMVLKDCPHKEVKCIYQILGYLERFHESARQLVQSWLSSNRPFKMIHQVLFHLQRYDEQEDKDPYILSLLSPQQGWHAVDSEYAENCLHILNIQDSAISSGQDQAKLYGLNITKEEYQQGQDFFIEMMYKVSYYIEGVRQVLNSHVKKNMETTHYEFQRPISNVLLEDNKEDAERCSICLSGYLEGQRVVKLGCGKVPHMFHAQCMNMTISNVPCVRGTSKHHWLKMSNVFGGNSKLITSIHDFFICVGRLIGVYDICYY